MLKAKENFLGLLKKELYVYTFIEVFIVLFGTKIEKIVFIGVEDIERNFKHVQNKMNENVFKSEDSILTSRA